MSDTTTVSPLRWRMIEDMAARNRVAFHIRNCVGTRDDRSSLHHRPCGRRRTAQGRCGSLLLHREGLSPSTPCRSPGALRKPAPSGLMQCSELKGRPRSLEPSRAPVNAARINNATQGVDRRAWWRRGVTAHGRSQHGRISPTSSILRSFRGRGAHSGGTLPYHHTKTVALDAQQVQQLLISTMKDRPAYLGLYAFALLLQLCPSRLLKFVLATR
jgi:hypothetical protein